MASRMCRTTLREMRDDRIDEDDDRKDDDDDDDDDDEMVRPPNPLLHGGHAECLDAPRGHRGWSTARERVP